METILIVEDDETNNKMVSVFLEKHGFNCTSAFSGTEALLLLKHDHFSLILLDLMLPGFCGEEVMKQFHNVHGTPVIILSAKDAIDSKVELLQNGADDYLCKPFDMNELLARIQVQLRKRSAYKDMSKRIYRDLILSLEDHSCTMKNQALSLTKYEFAILELLLRNPNKAYSKREIYESVWHEMYYADDKTINVHMSNLRTKLSKYSEEEYIQTLWGIGFKMVAPT